MNLVAAEESMAMVGGKKCDSLLYFKESMLHIYLYLLVFLREQ